MKKKKNKKQKQKQPRQEESVVYALPNPVMALQKNESVRSQHNGALYKQYRVTIPTWIVECVGWDSVNNKNTNSVRIELSVQHGGLLVLRKKS